MGARRREAPSKPAPLTEYPLANRPSVRIAAVLEALVVTFVWSTSWVLVKVGLKDIPPLTFAGLRYSLAFVCLLPFASLVPSRRKQIRQITRRGWARLLLLGLLFYAVTQGAIFVGLSYLTAISVNVLMNFTTIVVALLGVWLLAERPTWLQWGGIGISVVGVLLFFWPLSFPARGGLGLAIVLLGVITNAFSSVLGRDVNRDRLAPPMVITVVSTGVGGIVLLVAGVAFQGLPQLGLMDWALIAWLAVVNTAFAFTLWNHSLRTLAAVESSIINGTMLIQVPILAWLFLGERISLVQGIGMLLAGLGAVFVQLRRSRVAGVAAAEGTRL